jgi:hypothetical protein
MTLVPCRRSVLEMDTTVLLGRVGMGQRTSSQATVPSRPSGSSQRSVSLHTFTSGPIRL